MGISSAHLQGYRTCASFKLSRLNLLPTVIQPSGELHLGNNVAAATRYITPTNLVLETYQKPLSFSPLQRTAAA